MLDDDIDNGIGDLGFLASQHFVENTAETVYICTTIDFLPIGLFRTDVIGAAEKNTCRGQVTLIINFLGNTEIGKNGCVIVGEQDIRRFDIPVYDTVLVCFSQGAGDFSYVIEHFIG